MKLAITILTILFTNFSFAETLNWDNNLHGDLSSSSFSQYVLSNVNITAVEVSSPVRVVGEVTVPKSISFQISLGGKIYSSSGRFIVLGHFHAPMVKVFEDIEVLFFSPGELGATPKVLPQWFGVLTSTVAEPTASEQLDTALGRANMIFFRKALAATNAKRPGTPPVYVPSGVYVLDSPDGRGLGLDRFQSLVGDGHSTVLTLAWADYAYALIEIKEDSAANIAVLNLSIFGNAICNADHDGAHGNCQTPGRSISGIDISPAESPVIYSQFENLQIKEMSGIGISIDNAGAENISIKNNVIRDSSITNIYIEKLQQSVIDGNLLRSSKNPGTGSIDINQRWSSQKIDKLSITNNVIEDNKGFGIRLYAHLGSSYIPNRILIQGNRLMGDEQSGISIETGNNISIVNNYFHVSGTAVDVERMKSGAVMGNSVIRGGEAILPPLEPDNVMIEANFIGAAL